MCDKKNDKHLTDFCEVTLWTGPGPVPRDELLGNVENKHGLFCMLTDRIDSEVLDKAGKKLKIVATMSVGYDHIDVNEIKKRKIKIAYTPDILTDATAELAVALLLTTSRRLLEATGAAKIGEWKSWSPFWMCGPGLQNSIVGIVGVWPSEKAEAKEIGAEKVCFDELLTSSDFISVSCSLTPDTKELFNAAAFNKMKPTSIFINTSRGGVVDQNALIEVLENGKIWGAGLDVMTPEPLPLDSPLLKLKNCVILPHIGSACIETRKDMAMLCAKNIVAALKGEPLPTELVL
ncbi:hypothetical protein NQ317_011244 [Molorchus minor]|uniref:Glyoxylate reductase/hydroxypyruvate reductase n=1 Tax=Molorchus minor TaxID=1323400 RepID=A0ABQ9J8X6_9CUCU|nr:hypothetical protein NQ317_011244 [Molorchus minor]